MQLELMKRGFQSGLLGVLMLSSACSASDTFNDSKGEFHIACVPGWKVVSSGPELPPTVSVFMTGPVKDQFKPSINVVVQDVGKMSFHDYTKISTDQIADQIHAEVVSSDGMLVGGQPAIQLVYKARSNGRRLECREMWVVNQGKAYVVTALALEEDYQKWDAVFLKEIESFGFGAGATAAH
jgi:hypothetical protein